VNELERAHRSIGNMTTTMAQILGMHDGVELRWDPEAKTWHCEKAAPVIWFDSVLFSLCSGPTFGPWMVDGSPTRIKLTTANGIWIWVPTGRYEFKDRIDGGPATRYEARWPD